MSFAKDLTPRRWRYVEYLRAFATLAVISFHLEPHLNVILGRAPYAPGVINWFGFGGGDLFFLISGFVVWPAAWRHERLHVRDNCFFLLRRLLRVYIPYWAVLACVCVLGFVGASANLVKSALLFPQPIAGQVLPVAWTLVLEVIFYAFTFLLLFLPRRARFATLCGIAGIALLGNLLPLALGMIKSTQMYQAWSWVPSAGWFGPVVAKYLLSLHFLEFAIGAGIAELARGGVLERLAPYVSALWLSALAAFCAAVAAAVGFAGEQVGIAPGIILQRFAIAASVVTLIFLAAVCTEISLPREREGRFGAVLIWLGGGSLMIYLLHNVALEVAVTQGLRDWCASLGAPGAVVFALWFAATIALAGWIGNRIELPFHHRLVALLEPRAPLRDRGMALQR